MYRTRNQVIQPQNAADTPQPTPSPTPESIVEQLRAVSSQIPEATPLTPVQRETVRSRARTAKNGEILQTSISMIGATDLIANTVGLEAPKVRELCDEWNRWSSVEDELRAMLNGVSSANLVRQQRLSAIAETAYGVGVQLTRSPEHAALLPHVQEIKRLKKLERRKKPATTPQAPAPQTPPVNVQAEPKA